MNDNGNESLEQIARRCIAICEDKKAADIVLFDVRENSMLADYYLVCCGNSMPHVRAIAESLRRTLLSEGFKPRGLDGAPASQWVVLDFGSILIHVMTPEMRRRYCLEDLWDKRLIVFEGGERKTTRCGLAEGAANWPEIFFALKLHNRKPVFSFEEMASPAETVLDELKAGRDYLLKTEAEAPSTLIEPYLDFNYK